MSEDRARHLLFFGWRREKLGFLQQARDPHENQRTDEGHENGADDSPSRPNAKQSKNPAADDAADDAEENVHQDAVAATLHHLAREPAGDESYDDPGNESHVFPLFSADWRRPRTDDAGSNSLGIFRSNGLD